MIYNVEYGSLPTSELRMAKVDLIRLMEQIDDHTGGRLWIHRIYDHNAAASSQHRYGRAVDGHIDGLSLIDQYVLLERFNPGGLGLYGPDVWQNPGFHLDIREKFPTAKWGCVLEDGKRRYVALDKSFFRRIIRLEKEG